MARRVERAGKHFAGHALRRILRRPARSLPVPASVTSLVLVRQHNQLGDMLCSAPLLRTLRTAFPSAHISLVTSPVNHEVMLHHRCLDDVILFDKAAITGSGASPLKGLGGFLLELRRHGPSVAIVPCTVSTSFTSDMIAWLSRAATRIGCSELEGHESPSAFFLTHPVRLDWRAAPERHQTERAMDILAGWVTPDADLSHEMTLTAVERAGAAAFLKSVGADNAPNIALHPGAGKIPNRWPASRFSEAAEILAAEFGAKVFVTAGPMDDEPVADMERALSVPVTVVRRKPIREVAALLAAMDLVISNDTGIMHVAAAVGTPVLSLFGPTNPLQWAPRGPAHRWLQGEGGRIEAIGVDRVLRECRDMLRRQSSRVLA
jgi:ADP-heptose:LPS heptosyltransferase